MTRYGAEVVVVQLTGSATEDATIQQLPFFSFISFRRLRVCGSCLTQGGGCDRRRLCPMDLNPSSSEEDVADPHLAPSSSRADAAAEENLFPPHDHVIDGDEQQWVYYTTRTPDEIVSKIAAWFDASVQEVVQSNASRYPTLKGKSKLKQGTLLVIGATDSLLVCSSCRGDKRQGDEIVICDGECGRAYHQSCIGLDALNEDQWLCRFCTPSARCKLEPSERTWWKRPACGSWEMMSSDDMQSRAPLPPPSRTAPLSTLSRPVSKLARKRKAEWPAEQPQSKVETPPPSAPPPTATLVPAHPESFLGKVGQIKQMLGIADPVTVPEALRKANEMMGLPSSGTLPQQVDSLICKMLEPPAAGD